MPQKEFGPIVIFDNTDDLLPVIFSTGEAMTKRCEAVVFKMCAFDTAVFNKMMLDTYSNPIIINLISKRYGSLMA